MSFTGSRLEPVTTEPFAPVFFSARLRNSPILASASILMAVAEAMISSECFCNRPYTSAARAMSATRLQSSAQDACACMACFFGMPTSE